LKQNEDWTNGNWTESPTDKLTTSAPEQMMRNGKTPISVFIKILSHFLSISRAFLKHVAPNLEKPARSRIGAANFLDHLPSTPFFLVSHMFCHGHPIPMPSSLGADYQGHDPP